MRKLVFLTIFLLALTGCQNEEMEMTLVEGQGVIRATMEQGVASSRMVIDPSDNSLTWAAGDKFKVYRADGGQSSDWTLKNEDAGNKSGTFTGTEFSGDVAGAIYPSDIYKSYSGSTLTVNLSSNITYAGNNLNAPMWSSYTAWGESVSFKHLCALLKVNLNEIPDDYRILTVESKPSMGGTFVFDTTSDLFGESSGLQPSSTEAGTVTVDFSTYTLPENKSLWFFLPMPAVEYEYIKISIAKTSESTPQVLSEWTNRTITRAKVYRTSLTYKEIDATTPSEVSSQISSSVSEENKSVTLTMTNVIEATEGNNTITIPAVENTTLVFEQTPNTSGAPLVIAENENSSSTTEKLEISAPAESAALENLVIDTPNATVTLKEGNFGTVTATTAAHTMIIEEGVVVKNLVIEGGNVIVRGEVSNVTRHADNQDNETFVWVDGGSLKSAIQDADIIDVNPASWYEESNTNLTIQHRGELISFLYQLYNGTTFQGKTISLAQDIDMNHCPLEIPGMFYNYETYFMGTFDGLGYSIKNLNLNYTPTQESNNRLFLGLIPASESATFKNLTLENGKINSEGNNDNVTYWMGGLVGYAKATNFINCHNKGYDVSHSGHYAVAGLVGWAKMSCAFIACSNSATISVESSTLNNVYIGGIANGWGGDMKMVACYNTGTIKSNNLKGFAGGIAGDFASANQMYGCFNSGEVLTTEYAAALIGYGSLNNTYLYNSCYSGSLDSYALDWGIIVEDVRNLSYTDAVNVLNTGIEYYNTIGTISCEYRFVAGNTPALELAGEAGDGTGTPGLGEGEDL